MSVSLMVLIPIVLMGLVGALCFVGCVLPVSGLGPTLGTYGNVINKINGLQAFWPLNDAVVGNIVPGASDVAPKPGNAPGFDGAYMGTNNTSFKLSQQSIVVGDADGGACVTFNGVDGFVSVPFHQELNPPLEFTVEAWVKPTWAASNMQVKAVVASINTPQSVGWALIATPDGFWAANVGTGANPPPGPNITSVKSAQMIELGAVSYLAMTFKGGILSLFVGTPDGGLAPPAMNPANMPVAYMQELMSPPPSTATSLFIGMGRPDVTTGMFPFTGSIQDVAVYNVALDPQTIGAHFNLGNTLPAGT